MKETDPDAALEREIETMQSDVDDLERKPEHLGEDVRDVEKDWDAKRADPSVPGAQSPSDEEGEEVAGEWSGHAESAAEAGQ